MWEKLAKIIKHPSLSETPPHQVEKILPISTQGKAGFHAAPGCWDFRIRFPVRNLMALLNRDDGVIMDESYIQTYRLFFIER
jgi:hypothetical protein